MAALGFKKRFVGPIKRKKNPKRQTLRAFRKIPIDVGERLYLYTGMRTKHCKKIGEAECTSKYVIEITPTYYAQILGVRDHYEHLLRYTGSALEDFARDDGFKSWKELIQFWIEEHGEDCFPFQGELIRFRLLPKKQWKKQVPKSKLA